MHGEKLRALKTLAAGTPGTLSERSRAPAPRSLIGPHREDAGRSCLQRAAVAVKCAPIRPGAARPRAAISPPLLPRPRAAFPLDLAFLLSRALASTDLLPGSATQCEGRAR